MVISDQVQFEVNEHNHLVVMLSILHLSAFVTAFLVLWFVDNYKFPWIFPADRIETGNAFQDTKATGITAISPHNVPQMDLKNK